MELPIYHQSFPWQYLLASSANFSYPQIPENYVHWSQTPDSHIFSADLPGVRKEEVKVEVEDSIYLIIRTEAIDNESTGPAKSFMRKFRLPGNIDIDGISAKLEDGVLTVTAPRSYRRGGLLIDLTTIPDMLEVTARAA